MAAVVKKPHAKLGFAIAAVIGVAGVVVQLRQQTAPPGELVTLSTGGQVTVPGPVVLVGNAPRVPVWSWIHDPESMCTVANHTRAQAVSTTRPGGEDRRVWVEVRTGGCNGWVPDTRVSAP